MFCCKTVKTSDVTFFKPGDNLIYKLYIKRIIGRVGFSNVSISKASIGLLTLLEADYNEPRYYPY